MPDLTYPDAVKTTVTPGGILTRARGIHRVNSPKISLVSDLTMASVVAATWPDIPALFKCDEGRCLIAAVKEYSTDNPLRMVQLMEGGNGKWVYILPTEIPGWNAYCSLEQIQYPLSRPEEVIMDSNAWSLTIDAATNKPALRFQTNRPSGSAYTANFPNGQFAVWYMAPHMLDLNNNLTTIPEYHEEGVSNLVAALVLEIAANLASQFGDKQIFENKDLQGLGERLQGRANKCRETYSRIIGKDQVGFGPHFAEWDLPSNLGWRPFHPDNLY